MSDDPTPKPVETKPDEKTFTQADVDRIVADRLKREQAKYSDYDDLKAKAARFDEAEEKTKSETQRLAEANRAAEERAKKAELDSCRMRVAIRKGLTEAQVKRLLGTTEEELEADADELVAAFKSADAEAAPQPAPAGGRPKEKLRPGAVADAEPDPDPAQVLNAIPRY
jgi:hypothetical protein